MNYVVKLTKPKVDTFVKPRNPVLPQYTRVTDRQTTTIDNILTLHCDDRLRITIFDQLPHCDLSIRGDTLQITLYSKLIKYWAIFR